MFARIRETIDYIRSPLAHPTTPPPRENKIAFKLWSSAQGQLQMSRKLSDQFGDHPVMKILSVTGSATEALSRCVFIAETAWGYAFGSHEQANRQMTVQLQTIDVQDKENLAAIEKSEDKDAERIKELKALSAEAAAQGLEIPEFIAALQQQTSQMESMEKALPGILKSKPMTDKLEQLLKWDTQLAAMKKECNGLEQEMTSVQAEMSEVADSVEGLASIYKNVLAQKHKGKDDLGNVF